MLMSLFPDMGRYDAYIYRSINYRILYSLHLFSNLCRNTIDSQRAYHRYSMAENIWGMIRYITTAVDSSEREKILLKVYNIYYFLTLLAAEQK
jgi:hypothetical protein